MRAALAVIGVGVFLSACEATGSARAPTTHHVEIRGMAFSPAEVRVLPGDTVEWTNEDVIPHTVTAPDSAWTSPRLDPGQHWRWIAGEPSLRTYACAFHPMMRGRVIVEGPAPE